MRSWRLLSILALALCWFVTACSAPPPTSSVAVQPASPQPAATVLPATLAPAAIKTAVPPTATHTVVPPTDTSTPTRTSTATPTLTNTPTQTATATLTLTPSPSPTLTATLPPSKTPTRTRVPATATPKLPPLLAAINRTNAVKTSRYHQQAFYSNPFREIELLTVDGEVQGTNKRATLGGLLAQLCGCAGVPSIFYGDKYYYQKDGGWFYKARSSNVSQFDFDSKKVLSPNLTEFSKVGDEAVDGQACEVYSIDKQAGRKVFEQNNIIPAELMSDVVNVEVTYWVCADGYVRRSRLRADLLRPDGGTNISRTETHYFDFGAPIEITPPADAQPAP